MCCTAFCFSRQQEIRPSESLSLVIGNIAPITKRPRLTRYHAPCWRKRTSRGRPPGPLRSGLISHFRTEHVSALSSHVRSSPKRISRSVGTDGDGMGKRRLQDATVDGRMCSCTWSTNSLSLPKAATTTIERSFVRAAYMLFTLVLIIIGSKW